MYNSKATGACQVVRKVTDQNTFLCLKPVRVVLVNWVPQPAAICEGCARELAKEIIDSVPGGPRDAGRRR